MRYVLVFLGLWVGLCHAKTLDLPPELEAWQQWVLYEHDDASCPFISQQERTCVWPASLALNVTAQRADFNFKIDVFASSDVALPGGKNLWPQEVKNQQGYLAVVTKNGVPYVHLPAGQHVLTGQFTWAKIPLALNIPQHIGLLQLTLNGKRLAAPGRDSTSVWLRTPEQNKPQSKEADTLTATVFRRLVDGVPQILETQVQIHVSGQEREVTLGPLLLAGFTPRQFQSPLPARLEPNGNLRLQVKPGNYQITLLAHAPEMLAQFNVTPTNTLWPAQEVWVFEAARTLRTVQLDGAPIIDGSQTQMPIHWQDLPAYLITPNTTLALTEQHRGDPTPAENDLTLDKTQWLAFAGTGFTVEDSIDGTMHQNWRLEAAEPYQLMQAELNGEPQVITALTDGGPAGVEVRQREVALVAVSELPWQTTLPVSGWQQEFSEVDTTFHLPPGWAGLHISGADSVQGTWLSRWNLWDIFLVLVIAVSLWRVVNWPTGLLALVTLVLVYQRANAPLLGWLNLAACLALLPFVKGRFAQVLIGYLAFSFAVLLVIVLPFMVQEARLGLYPQLESTRSAPYAADNFTSAKIVREQVARPDMSMASDRLEEVVVHGIRKSKIDYQADYNPAQKIQVGPGLPDWQWQSASAHWSGPVTISDTTRLYFSPPWLTRLGHWLALILVAALFALLGKRFWQTQPLQHWPGKMPISATPAGAPTAAGALLVALFFSGLPYEQARANVVIDKELLNTLEQRLLAPPECLPHCAGIESVIVEANANNLKVKLLLNLQEAVGVPLPANSTQWWPTQVTSAGKISLQTQANQLWALLPAGRHWVTLSGPLNGQESVNLNFQLPIQNVSVSGQGWTFSGLPTTQQTSQTLQLKREIKTKQSEQIRLTPAPIPAFVSVKRSLNLGLEWTVVTEVRRIAPAEGAIHLSIPLLAGEAPTNGEVNAAGQMDVRLGASQRMVSWRSNLPISNGITLSAPTSVPWTEEWRIRTTPVWHSQFEGIPQVASNNENVWPLWLPRPGETVTVVVTRPTPTAGREMAIDEVILNYQPGKRVSDTELEISLRATFGSQLELPLPANASLKKVLINGIETPISHTQNSLKIPVVPGEQTIALQWQEPHGAALKTPTPAYNLGLPAANIHLQLNLPRDRWVLLVGGPALGPAILFWGMLVVVLMIAVALGKSGFTPLKVYEWVLLSLGVATFNFWVLGLVAVWLVALTLRGRTTVLPDERNFNLLQIFLCVLSVITLLVLVSSVPSSLLSNPQMYITGNSSSAFNLQWYQDQTQAALPQGWVISLPMFAYRILMLLWSLWLAFALMRWIKWGWVQINAGGFWVSEAPKVKP